MINNKNYYNNNYYKLYKMMLKDIKKYIYTIWTILYFYSIISFSFSFTIGYKFYYDFNYLKLFIVCSFNSLITFILFICINKLSNFIKQCEYDYDIDNYDSSSDDNNESDNDELSEDEINDEYEENIDDEELNEEIEYDNKQIINILNKDIEDRWLFYKKICFYELINIKHYILTNPINSTFYNELKEEFKEITIKNKNISYYEKNLRKILYYLYLDMTMFVHFKQFIKPLNSIYYLC